MPRPVRAGPVFRHDPYLHSCLWLENDRCLHRTLWISAPTEQRSLPRAKFHILNQCLSSADVTRIWSIGAFDQMCCAIGQFIIRAAVCQMHTIWPNVQCICSNMLHIWPIALHIWAKGKNANMKWFLHTVCHILANALCLTKCAAHFGPSQCLKIWVQSFLSSRSHTVA